MERVVIPMHEAHRGAGGKLRRPTSRKPPASPYARPPEGEHQRRRWLSKLVDPACRLISGGATMIFPSFFSKSESTSDIDADIDAEVEGVQHTVEQNQVDNDHECISDLKISNLTGEAGPSNLTSKLDSGSNFNEPTENEKVKQYGNNDLSEIEQLVKKATFSRDQAKHLMEILSSRVMELPKFNQGKESTNLIAGENKTSLATTHDFPKISDELKLEYSNGVRRGPATPFLQSNIHDEIGASPADIARAYMFSRTSEARSDSKEKNVKCENTIFPSPMRMTSTCWPGAVVKDAYLTPQNQRGRYGFQNFPRTPYSKTILSRSKTRLTHMLGDDHVSTTSYQQSQTPTYSQTRSNHEDVDGGYGSVGPIRRIRHNAKLQSPWGGSRILHSSVNGSLQMEKSRTLEGLNPVPAKNMETGEIGLGMKFHSSDDKRLISDVRIPPVHSHTSLMARKILEHIDRNPPTPKEKLAELKLAIKWKQPESSGVDTNVLSHEKNHLVQFRDTVPQKCSDHVDGEKNSLLKDEDQETCYGNIVPDNSKASDGISKGFLSSNFNLQSNIPVNNDDARKSKGIACSRDVPLKFTQDVSMPVPNFKSDGNTQMEQSNTSAGKPDLPSISINKPESKWAFTSDSGSGFTFPVSASASMLFEPPTPSIMPTSSVGHLHPSKEDLEIPSYSFGLKSPTAALVFSFPSTSTAASHDDDRDIKFSFGSDQKSRLSFSSFGNHAVCY